MQPTWQLFQQSAWTWPELKLEARDYQILFLGLFLLLGLSTRDWTLDALGVGLLIATCLLTQGVLSWVVGRGRRSAQSSSGTQEACGFNWRSPLITALGLSLLLRSDHPATLAIAACLAIASKFMIRSDRKHLFNPANFGIIAALALTGDAWVSPGQWGDSLWYSLIFLGTGGIVLGKVGRWDTSVAFLASYSLLEALRNLWLGWTWDVWFHRLSSGSLLLFALFMVTDPRSIPNARTARLLWAGAIAGLAFILQTVFFVPTAVFWALFIGSLLTPWLDRQFQANRFTWQREERPQPRLLQGASRSALPPARSASPTIVSNNLLAHDDR